MMMSALQDTEGAQARKGKRLRRRIYHNKVTKYYHIVNVCMYALLFSL